jgi:uncharacterized 2Fe-2S/4Fe-4S cluster protein (DUF4445 family)
MRKGNKERTIAVQPGLRLLDALRTAGIAVPAVCGGQGTCGKCRVRVFAGALPETFSDRDCLPQDVRDAGYRLACAAFPDEEGGDLGVEVVDAGEGSFSALDDYQNGGKRTRGGVRETRVPLEKDALTFARQLSPQRELTYPELREAAKLADAGVAADADVVAGAGVAADGADTVSVYRQRDRLLLVSVGPEPVYAVAADIGTTTLALALLDMRTGAIAARFSAVNRQRAWGVDVLSRIQCANDGGLAALSGSIRDQMSEGIAALCREVGIGAGAIRKIAVAGNTTMLHLLLQLSCRTLGCAPFTPVTLDMVTLAARELFAGDFCCETALLPGISTYVGADITAGLLFAGIPGTARPRVFMDIGTNGEVALIDRRKGGKEGRILCAATAAGPAFEGGNIRWGTGSVPGAICRARFQDGAFVCSTIGNRPPTGICGSAVIDIVYEGLKYGLIDPSGRLHKECLPPSGDIVLAQTEDGQDIVFCQKDVRELQLAKSAVRTGLDALLGHAGLGYDDIETLYLAGGFGFNLNLESGAGIGLIPEVLRPKVSLVGNSALGGTVAFLLDPAYEKTARRIVGQAEEFSLPQDPYFNRHFIDNLSFGQH